MTDPIKIMDEIERELTKAVFASLRTAIERQNERIDMLKSQTESLAQEALDKSEELAQARARIARLEQAIASGVGTGMPFREWYPLLKSVLNESEPQSPHELRGLALDLQNEADRIEREGEEES